MITSKNIRKWQDLQDETARILSECGFVVEVEKSVQTVRGEVELDVYAEELVDGRRYAIVCECKHWQQRIPQNVVHGFRTVVADIGANQGLIVASSGFQSGANAAATMTNVKLVTWEEFQAEFEASWLKHYLNPTVSKRCNALLTFTEPLLPAWYPDMSEDKQAEYIALKRKHEQFGWLMMRFTHYVQVLQSRPLPALPLREHVVPTLEPDSYIPEAILDATGYREFLEAAFAHSDSVTEQFRSLRPRELPADDNE